MGAAGRITSVDPPFAIPGGEIEILCEGFTVSFSDGCGVSIDGVKCEMVAASSERVLALVPYELDGGRQQLFLESSGDRSDPFPITVGRELTSGMHMVANPAIDPADDSIILTRSGSRGQQLPVTLFRLDTDGRIHDMPEPILNPTGLAFGPDGELYVTNRAQGEVYTINSEGASAIFATGLGVATAIAFDAKGTMHVGDRAGTIYRVRDFADVETFAVVEPSVAAHHIAFGPNGDLYLTAPGFASKDAIYTVDSEGFSDVFFRGLGRPQGIAFDTAGNLYAAACYRGKRGIIKISSDGETATHLVAGPAVVGLCFTRQGEMIVATNDTIYSIPMGIYGTLLS